MVEFINTVSLFTREWIEIDWLIAVPARSAVSLFTREWIEIGTKRPSTTQRLCLPLYEGVD